MQVAWYWIADFCSEHKIPFALGLALYMKAIHGGKTKNDKIDSYKIAKLLMGGNTPTVYPYPAKNEGNARPFAARVIRLTLTVESKSQDATSAPKSMWRSRRKKKLEPILKGSVSY
jgi:transposase